MVFRKDDRVVLATNNEYTGTVTKTTQSLVSASTLVWVYWDDDRPTVCCSGELRHANEPITDPNRAFTIKKRENKHGV